MWSVVFRYIISMRSCRSQRPCGLRRRSTAACLLKLWVRIPPGAWMFVSCGCHVLSGRGLCDELITRPEESYRLWCVVVCDVETSWMRMPWPAGGCRGKDKKNMRYSFVWDVTQRRLGVGYGRSGRTPHLHCCGSQKARNLWTYINVTYEILFVDSAVTNVAIMRNFKYTWLMCLTYLLHGAESFLRS